MKDDIVVAGTTGGGEFAGCSEGDSPKFIVDNNVGKLAKWLRIMGYDALFINPIEDNTLVDIGLREDRIVLTRDNHILRRRVTQNGSLHVIFINNDDLEDQLRQVIRTAGLDATSKLFTRCLRCNQSLMLKSREEIKGLVPPHVYATQEKFSQCPNCGRIYWPGTHWERMKEKIREIIQR